MKRLFLTMTVLAGLSGSAIAQSTPFLGQIMIFAGNFCPVGWAATDGSLQAISTNVALFALLGVTYGGNGTTNFALPHMQPIFTQNRATFVTCIATAGVFPSRN